MSIFIIILLIAAAPLLFIFIFSEVMTAKEGKAVSDVTSKFSKGFAWLIFGLIIFFLIYILINNGPAFHLRQFFRFIGAGLEFLK